MDLMKYFHTGPERRDPGAPSVTISEIRNAIRQGTLSPASLLYPESGDPPQPAERIVATPPPLPSSVEKQPVKRKESLAWLWISLGVVVFCIILTVGGSLAAVHFVREAEMAILSDVPMAEERNAHQTKWIENENYEADGPPDEPDSEILKLVSYPADVGELAAYLSPDPGDGNKHPVIIWAKGGFGGIGEFFWDEPSRLNDQSARAFREAGIVLMCPSYRGENENPGKFELFYGEVNDFLSAVEYAKSLPYVDPERVYLGGHSTGGTMTLLAAATGVECRAVFSFGGEPDLRTVMSDGEGYDNTPYDIESERDHELRSAIRYTHFIKSPTYYIEGGEYIYSNEEARKMERLASMKKVPFKALIVEKADHFNILNSSTNLIAKKILADTGDRPITLTSGELDSAWIKLNGISLTSELQRWTKDGGDLEGILDNLETDIEITSLSVISVVESAVSKVLNGTPDDTTDISELAEICDYIEDEELRDSFTTRIGPNLRSYITACLAKEKRSEMAEDNCLRIAGTLALSGDEAIPPLITQLANRQFAADNDNWDYIFDEIEENTEMGRALVADFQDTPLRGPLAKKLMTKVNLLLIDDAEAIPKHPYDSDSGAEALARMIEENGDETFQATLSLAFVDEEYRKKLLPEVLEHPDVTIRMEAGWVDAKSGGKSGIKILQQACLDVEHSETGKSYLRELELEKKIPAESKEPAFAAMAEMVDWLKHPNEMGEAPAAIEQIDHRKLYWPPDEEEIDLRLFRFTYPSEDRETGDTYYGIVGGMIWSSFRKYPSEPDVSQLYGHHCALELMWKEDDDETKISDREGLRILREKNPGKLPNYLSSPR